MGRSRLVPLVLAVAAAVALLVLLGLNRLSSGPSLDQPTPSKGLEIQPAGTTTTGR